MRPDWGGDSEEGDESSPRRVRDFNLTPTEGTNFDLSHRHSGIHGDGKRVQAASLDTNNPFPDGAEPTYTPVNAPTSGRKWRIQIVEVTDPDTQQIMPVVQVVPAT